MTTQTPSADGRSELALIDPGEHGPVSFRDAVVQAIGELECEEHPGWGPDPRDMRVLCAIQQRFAKLWQAEASHG